MFKSFPAQLATVLHSRRGQRNVRVLLRYFVVLATMITLYSVLFHVLMLREGQQHSWITGFYWTLTVMSTLGFGDITFHTDLGRMFSILVLSSGTIFLLVLLPFTFIEFFYEPWMQSQAESRAPRKLPRSTHGHVLLTNHDAVTTALIQRLDRYGYPYAIVVPEVSDALDLHDLGFNVMVGDFDDPQTWINACVESAALVVSTADDVCNTSVAFTVRDLAQRVPIITSASREASIDVLELAGSTQVLRLEEMIGQSFSRRTIGGDARSHVIGRFDRLLIAEATAHRTPLVGKTLAENQLRDKVGVTVLGIWERGRFEPGRPETMIHNNTVLVLAGTKDTLSAYDELLLIYNISTDPVLILGGGRVGRATARALARRKVDYRIVELQSDRVRDPKRYVVGDAANLEVLEKAGIRTTPTVIITPHEDEMNVFLTIYCRRLRPDVQIMSRATNERNVATLHRAGADTVLSYASMGASAAMNVLQSDKSVMVAEGLDLFEVTVPAALAGKTIIESAIREDTGCSVVAIQGEGGMAVVPDPSVVLEAETDIVLIGTAEAERSFLQLYGPNAPART